MNVNCELLVRVRRRFVTPAWKFRRVKSALVLASGLLAIAVCAGPARAEWQTFGPGDGLVHTRAQAILEDSIGNLWFGTYRGVSRYDGVTWTTCIYNTDVRAIIEDNSGDIWFGTSSVLVGGGSGVGRFDGMSWTWYTTADGLAGNDVLAILEDSSGDLWFGTKGGVSRYDGVGWTTYTTADGLAADHVLAIIEDGSGDLWFGTWGGGVSRYDGVSWTTYTTADGLGDDDVLAVIEDRSGSLWFGTFGGGVSCFDGVNWTMYTTADGLADDYVLAVVEDSSGNLWFGTHDGVSRFDGMSWTTYTTADGLAHNDTRAIAEDASGNLWFGTYGGGVSRYDGVGWATYTTADGLAHDDALAVIEDSSADLWFGTLGGVSCYDGVSWTTYTTADGLAANSVSAIIEDSSADLWFGTYGGGVSRYDGVSWTTYTTADGLAANSVSAIIEDSSADLWFGTHDGGVSRYDGVNWTTYTTADGLVANMVRAITEDSSGNLWFGTENGVSRYDGVEWTTYTINDGLAANCVYVIAEDSSGNLWFGTSRGGVSRYDGVGWTTYTTEDGLADNDVLAIIEDSSGHLWFGTVESGVSCYNGVSWITYTTADGLAANCVPAVLEIGSGGLWFATVGGGVSAHEPDRVAPQTVIWPKPALLTTSRTVTIVFTAAFGESWGVRFSHSFDGSTWSEWTSANSWVASALSDGYHTFEVTARDAVGNVDSTPAVFTFEVDASPPVPIVISPVFGGAVRDSIAIQGTAADARFAEYVLDVRIAGSSSWDVLKESGTPVTEGALGGWNTALVPDGDYELRLSVSDTLGLTGTALIRVEVDNESPWAWETSPVMISASSGGDVYSTDNRVHMYFPPHALANDASVSVTPADEGSVPDTLAGGAQSVSAGYEVSWESIELGKLATLRMALMEDGNERPLRSVLALYVLEDGEGWQRLGGTVESDGASISAAIELEGTYAVFSDSGGPAPGGGLSALSFTPRVFSPSGSFANTEVAISFTLGRAGPVTAKVYNRAGRLVDELVSRLQMNAGANVVRWDGRDGDGAEVPDGLYLVAIDALGETQVRTLAVVR
jgi:ligand-binding sensor domain-containing protein